MNDQLAERLCVALEQIALELVEANAKGTVPVPVLAAVAAAPAGPFPPIGGGRPPAPWACPVHHTSKIVPAGFSTRTQKPYEAFTACAEHGCNEKPPRYAQPAPERAMPPSEGIQPRQLP